jgi:hypothetical protein
MLEPDILKTDIKKQIKFRYSLESVLSDETVVKNNNTPVLKYSNFDNIPKVLRFDQVCKRKISPNQSATSKIKKFPTRKALNLFDPEKNENIQYFLHPDLLIFGAEALENTENNYSIDEDCETDEDMVKMSKEYLLSQIKSSLISENI